MVPVSNSGYIRDGYRLHALLDPRPVHLACTPGLVSGVVALAGMFASAIHHNCYLSDLRVEVEEKWLLRLRIDRHSSPSFAAAALHPGQLSWQQLHLQAVMSDGSK